MIRYVSTKGGISPVSFDEAVLQGFAADGGLFVPETIPVISINQLEEWSCLGFVDLAFEILSLFIDPTIISKDELKLLVQNSFTAFEHPDIVPLVPIGNDNRTYVMELFHGPTLSFKDVAMGFLINIISYFLEKKNDHISLILATTGDTGPAAAHAAAGKQTIDCWPLYPKGMISEEQERQMTTLDAANIHPVGVENCPDGGDDLDIVVARMFADRDLRQRLKLSSVNSINWCRVMVQAVHYFYGYYQAVEKVGEKIIFSVPTGAFGNLFGGYLARSMGLPVESFICANNKNKALHTAYSTGIFKKTDLQVSVSSAIDIVVPYNFWRFLYFCSGCDHKKIASWMSEFSKTGEIHLDDRTVAAINDGFCSTSVSDDKTLKTISRIFEESNGCLLDPHGAVAVAAVEELKNQFPNDKKIICLATAHPAKFPDVIKKALQTGGALPGQAVHKSLEKAAKVCQHIRLCNCKNLEYALVEAMTKVISMRPR